MAFKNRGFTLIEFIVVFGLIGIIAVLISTPYFGFFRLFLNQFTAIDVATENKLALDEIVSQIRQSESVATSCPPCYNPNDSSTQDRLILRLWPIDAQGKPFYPANQAYDYIVYDRINPQLNIIDTQLRKTTYPAVGSTRRSGTKVNGTNVSSLQFAYDAPAYALYNTYTVTVTLGTSKVYDQKTHTILQSADAALRNK